MKVKKGTSFQSFTEVGQAEPSSKVCCSNCGKPITTWKPINYASKDGKFLQYCSIDCSYEGEWFI